MFSTMDQIKKASRETTSQALHWFSSSSMRFFNTELYENDLFPIGQRGVIFITSEYMDDPKYKSYSLRYATRNVDGFFKIETLDDFMGYDSLQDAIDGARSYQNFYHTIMDN
ncbi:hypothetical protein SEA_YABOI_278 [Streptomyces phage Yaboi]|jgi:hypothetical protein|uniref:Uncharacterized protein n=3 Tax=Streptomyces virus Yaboi TaxID=2846408 RepID=A0A411C4U4_9CAUD|nr:hypothetical protein HWB86_gp017 [Streptomyces phage Yaboi]YP_009841369.1 hypothetical protein HWB86_gp049 [Streptomyces phage Yaboi]QAY08679.1 hypothetical protein SEA_GENIE2_17 [Streptomyces phage Genie2]QAY12669.1 hypothetical protein SEA_BOOMERJR_17 [Streptomyces phage BoomerJR]UVD39865.1 hypothetical protein SEA_STANIMAL_17 [Streptomyces phage Stanimal]WNM73606.1 hypothetical protein SEA_SOLLERTIA_17 [Streptomyces phage Sollertia]AYB70856.1 hypothetical protein SEA_YABOI_17 [Streptomy